MREKKRIVDEAGGRIRELSKEHEHVVRGDREVEGRQQSGKLALCHSLHEISE